MIFYENCMRVSEIFVKIFRKVSFSIMAQATVKYGSKTYVYKDFDVGQTVSEFLEAFAKEHNLDDSNLYLQMNHTELQDDCIFEDNIASDDINIYIYSKFIAA